MSRTARFFIFLSLSLACLLASGILAYRELQRYNTTRGVFPPGSQLAGIPVGGLTAQPAGERVLQAFALTPVELRVDGSPIHLDARALGQQIDLDGMLRAVEMIQAGQQPYWSGFWDFLFNRLPSPFDAPLACTVTTDTLRAYLQSQIAPRYVQAPSAAFPIPGDVRYEPGQPGQTLDIEPAIPQLEAALCSRTARTAELTSRPSDALPPNPSSLEPVLQTLVQVSSFDGLIELYYQDLDSGHEVSFAYNGGRFIAPGVAFTAASTIKIPVMVSAYKRLDGPLDGDIARQMALMIDLSDNDSTDAVMEQALDPNIAPVQVTQDMQALNLKDTFLAGFFYPGAPLLDRYETPGNQRTDLSTDPDMYNQTTAADMGRLLAAIQRCADDGSGPFSDAFGGSVTKDECTAMIDLLAKNRKGVLIENGVPEGTRMAHKYGWVTDSLDGLMHNASDAAIVYTPTGRFVLTVYLYHPQQLDWDAAQRMVARLTTGLINYYREQ